MDVNLATPVGGGNCPARSLSNVFAIRVSGMSPSVIDGEVVSDLSIDTYRPRTPRARRDRGSRVGAHLTEHPVGGDCRRGKFCVHSLQLLEDLAHPFLHIFELNPNVTVTHAGTISTRRARADRGVGAPHGLRVS